ncbi:MAG: PAS domain-containing protein [Chloroflexi bacterium]|nr:PAS domain-containing protein [Chloroflexota bacterium]
MNDRPRDQGEAVLTDEQPDRVYPAPTTRHEIEVILARQLAGYLALPIVIMDTSHAVVYYNEPAERMLGRRFDEGGPVPWSDWSQAFTFTDDAGQPVSPGEMPLGIAVRHRQLAHRTFWMRGLDGVPRHMDETAIPLVGNAGRFLGAVAIFQEMSA